MSTTRLRKTMNFRTHFKEANQKLVSFDFDDTLKYANGQTNMSMVRKAFQHHNAGDKVIIVTSRHDIPAWREEIEQFIRDEELEDIIEEIHFLPKEFEYKEPFLRNLGVHLHHDDDEWEIKQFEGSGVDIWPVKLPGFMKKYYEDMARE